MLTGTTARRLSSYWQNIVYYQQTKKKKDVALEVKDARIIY
jgi:hypothetical protein